MQRKKLPATVLSGFLGAGKTTLLMHLLQQAKGKRVAVIVNDFSAINIDALQLGATVARAEEELIALSNGCICCSLRADLVREVERLASQGQFDYLLVEGSGISDPLTIAQTFSIDDHERQLFLSHFATLDTLATVIDAHNFYDAFFSASHTTDEGQLALLMSQVEFANVLIINKIEMLFEEQLQRVEAFLALSNPAASIVKTSFGQVAFGEVCHTGRYEGSQARKSADWLERQHAHGKMHGLRSFAYFERRPFHPERFWQFLESLPKGILRSKGLFWIASRPDTAMRLNQAGLLKHIAAERLWWGSMPESERVQHEEYLFSKAFILSRWDETYRDRMNELVFIGLRLHEEAIRAKLEECVCTPDEIEQMKKGYPFIDPFPVEEVPKKEGAFKYLKRFLSPWRPIGQ